MSDSPEPGTLIEGTLRDEDLIPAFINALPDDEGKELARQDFEKLLFGDDWRETCEDRNYACCNGEMERIPSTCLVNGVGPILEELFNRLDSISPPGHYFGAHPGDGSDFGWWPIDDPFSCRTTIGAETP